MHRESLAEPGELRAETETYLGRVRELAPCIAAAAPEIERTRRVPQDLLDALHAAALYRMLIPRRYAGGEVHPLVFMRTVQALARADASIAWNIGQNAVCAIVAAYLEPEVAQAIFGDPRAVLAWGPAQGPVRAVVCEGGYRVTGRWSFASGMRQATWLGPQCPVFEADGNPRRSGEEHRRKRVFLVPASAARAEDVWDVIGLRGTASDAFEVEDLFVPEAYSVHRESPVENREPGWLYCFSIHNLFSCGFASIALGVAQAMLDAFIELAAHKVPRGMHNTARENAVVQGGVARARAKLESAEAYLLDSVEEICDAVRATREVTLAQRMRIRLCSTHAIHAAREAGEFAYEAAGATAVFAANPFERRFRDLHTIAQQLQGRAAHFETVGQHLLGLDADTTFL
ncbi:MAG: acyl-CoA dehydrogenase family protein [Betaproteobacteria bacterium]|jgi:alkylation response protein AidB-like acyl-CoA dehydrogenase|nr:acyl-CoA dehydrogenase family protein [Betaproteobacteria bacterium]